MYRCVLTLWVRIKACIEKLVSQYIFLPIMEAYHYHITNDVTCKINKLKSLWLDL